MYSPYTREKSWFRKEINYSCKILNKGLKSLIHYLFTSYIITFRYQWVCIYLLTTNLPPFCPLMPQYFSVSDWERLTQILRDALEQYYAHVNVPHSQCVVDPNKDHHLNTNSLDKYKLSKVLATLDMQVPRTHSLIWITNEHIFLCFELS